MNRWIARRKIWTQLARSNYPNLFINLRFMLSLEGTGGGERWGLE